jgi:hypothetical protein
VGDVTMNCTGRHKGTKLQCERTNRKQYEHLSV